MYECRAEVSFSRAYGSTEPFQQQCIIVMTPSLGPSQVFLPWIGSRYADDGLDGVRILALGESHCGVEDDKHRGFTQFVVRRWGLEKRSKYFTIIAKYVLGLTSDDYLRMKDRREFWQSVAFYNYIQDVAGAGPAERPTEEMCR